MILGMTRVDVISTLQLKNNSESYNFSMKVDQRRIETTNRSASKHRKSARKDITSLRKQAKVQNSCLEVQLYDSGIAE